MRVLTFAWSPNPAGDNVLGYRLFVGRQSNTYGPVITLGNVTSTTFNADPEGRWYFALKAFNAQGDSPFSAEILVDTTLGVARWMSLVGRG